MSETAGWHGESQASPHAQNATDVRAAGAEPGVRERISAVSFKNLTARLKLSPSIQVSLRKPQAADALQSILHESPATITVAPVQEISPIQEVSPVQETSPIQITTNGHAVHVPISPETTEIASEAEQLVPEAFEPSLNFDPVLEAQDDLVAAVPEQQPEQVSGEAPPQVADPIPEQTLEATPESVPAPPDVSIPEPVQVTPEPEPAPLVADAISSARISSVLESKSPQNVSLAKPPPILPPPDVPVRAAAPAEPVPSARTLEAVLEVPHRRVRDTEDLELEKVMRMIVAVPTAEERLEFLDRAAVLAAQDEQQSAPKSDLAQIEERFLQSVNSGVLNPRPEPVQHEEPEPFLPQPVEEIVEVEAIEAIETEAIESIESVHHEAPVSTPATREAPAVVHSQFSNLEGQEAGELARTLLDMMAAGAGNAQPHERALAADTLLRLLPRLDTKPLVLLSERLAMMDQPPALLVARLIRDPRVEISGPLLENSIHVTDLDLVHVIAEGTADQRRVIARRRKLTRLITDKLIATREAPVLLTLVRNANAEISHEGFLDLLNFANNDSDLLAPLSTRADLPAPFAFELFWIAPPQLRRYILNRFLTDSETLTKILKITLATQGTAELSPDKSFPPPEMVERGIALFAEGHAIASDEHFANLLSLDPKTVGRVMSDKHGDSLAIMLKAAGVSRSDFAVHLVRLRSSDYAVLDLNRNMEELQTLFDQLSFNKARILLTYWDWASRKSGPYAPIN